MDDRSRLRIDHLDRGLWSSKIFSSGAINRVLEVEKFQLANWDRLGYLVHEGPKTKRASRTRTFSLAEVFFLAILRQLKAANLPIVNYWDGLRNLNVRLKDRGTPDISAPKSWLLLSKGKFEFAESLEDSLSSKDSELFLAMRWEALVHNTMSRLKEEIVQERLPGYDILAEALIPDSRN
jgi:hypothetical protein